MRAIIIASLAFGALGMAQPALADDRQSGAVRVSARVPIDCGLSAASVDVPAMQGRVQLSVMERCNSNRGFQIIASHRFLSDDERVVVHYGDEPARELDPAGLSPIVFRSGARFGPVPVSIAARDLATPLSLSFALTAL